MAKKYNFTKIPIGRKVRIERETGGSFVGEFTHIFLDVCAEQGNRPAVTMFVTDDTGEIPKCDIFWLEKVKRIDVLE